MKKHNANLVIYEALLNSASSSELASWWRSNPLLPYKVQSIYRFVETTASHKQSL